MGSSHKKSAIIITRFPYESQWGGEESHTLQIARHLSSKGFKVIFLGSCKVLLKRMADEGFLVKKVWGGKMIVTWWELLKSLFIFPLIKNSLRKNFDELSSQYDIQALYCLSLNEKLFLSSYVSSQGIPVTWVEHQEIRAWLTKSPWRHLYRHNSRSVQIVPISKNNEQLLLNSIQVSSKNITEIINGVDVAAIKKMKQKKERGLIVYANRLTPKKGVLDFIESLDYLPDKKNISVIIVGDGQLEYEVEKIIKKSHGYKSISHLNYLKKENWYKLLNRAEVFVSCSVDTNETFSLNSAEALAAGGKLVVTKPCGIVSFLTDNSDAVFADAQNPVNLAHKILTALELENLSDNARSTALKKFNLPEMLKNYDSLILRK